MMIKPGRKTVKQKNMITNNWQTDKCSAEISITGKVIQIAIRSLPFGFNKGTIASSDYDARNLIMEFLYAQLPYYTVEEIMCWLDKKVNFKYS